MSNELIKAGLQEISSSKFSEEQKELLKTTICKGCSDDQMHLFEYVCKRTGLDPFMKQIYAVVRKDHKASKEQGKDVMQMTIQTSIDGLRLIADRTGNYVPGKEPTYQYDKNGMLLSATAYVKKRISDGSWHEIGATAFYTEYVQSFQDYNTKQSVPTKFWSQMPHNQLAKCAEALVIRKCFPADCSGVYASEEMMQADSDAIDVTPPKQKKKEMKELPTIEPKITPEQAESLGEILVQCDPAYLEKVWKTLRDMIPPIKDLREIPVSIFDRLMSAALKNRESYQPQLAKTDSETQEIKE
jgi:phage recombination protein Bet